MIRGSLSQWFFRSLFKGLLIVVPAAVTIWMFRLAFTFLDGLLRFPVPGMGFVVTLAIVVAIGALGSTFLFSRLWDWCEEIIGRVPVAKLVYFSLKDFVGAFVGEKKGFNRPVMVSLGGEADVKVLGFATAEDLDVPGTEGFVAVYLQQSYNFAGNLVLVPRDRVTPLPPEESARWLSFIVSGGVAGKKKAES